MQKKPTLEGDSLDAEFQLHAQETAQKRAEELLIIPNQLLSKQALVERCKQELIEEFATYRKRQSRGVECLTKALTELSQERPQLFTGKVIEDINSIAALSEQEIVEGVTLQELAHVDDTSMGVLYQAAKRIFEQKRFDDAADIFSFLMGLNRNTFAFCIGLANAEYQRKAYKEALSLYSYMCKAWPNNPVCYLSASHCHKALNEPDQAIAVLENARTAIAGHPDLQKWRSIFSEELMAIKQGQYT